MRTPLVLATLVTIAIGGTGRAADLLPLADGGHIALYAYAVDRSGLATPLGTCEAVAVRARAACRTLRASVADARRTAALAEISKDFSGARLGAFARLVAAEGAFAHALGANEVDAAGDRAAAERAEKDAFLRRLQALLRGEAGVRESVAALDGALNDTYASVMATPASGAWGDVDKTGIRRTERAWLAYRDAFSAFAATLWGRDAAARVEAELTRRRTASLEAFLED